MLFRSILGHLGECGRLFSLDQDEDARQNSLDDPRFTFVHSNFRFLKNFMRYYGVERVDGILADLGVSFHHFDDSDRGFSFRFEGPLDMRMNRRSGQTAAQLIATCSEEKLADLFFLYGELKSARRIAAYTNRALESAGRPERIDHRSYKRQGIDKIPSVHLGPAASQMEKRGIRTDKGEVNRQIAADNKLLKEIKARITRLYRWSKAEAEKPQTQQSSLTALWETQQQLNEIGRAHV